MLIHPSTSPCLSSMSVFIIFIVFIYFIQCEYHNALIDGCRKTILTLFPVILWHSTKMTNYASFLSSKRITDSVLICGLLCAFLDVVSSSCDPIPSYQFATCACKYGNTVFTLEKLLDSDNPRYVVRQERRKWMPQQTSKQINKHVFSCICIRL